MSWHVFTGIMRRNFGLGWDIDMRYEMLAERIAERELRTLNWHPLLALAALREKP